MLKQRVLQDESLDEIGKLTHVVLVSLNNDSDALYAASVRPLVAPGYVLRVRLLQAFYSVRSEREVFKQLDSNLLFGCRLAWV